jgi:AcrR family transcriptional regulator
MEYIYFDDMTRIKGVNRPKSQLGFTRMAKLCETAERLFSQNGFYETSISDICRETGVAVGTFYIYFQDKSAIYCYLVNNYYAVIKRHLKEQTKNCRTRYEMEREGLKAFIRFGHDHPQCYKILWGSMYIDPQLFEDYYLKFAISYTRALANSKDELADVDYSVAAYALMGISNFVCLKTVFTHTPLSETELDAVTDEAMKLLSGGLFKKTFED